MGELIPNSTQTGGPSIFFTDDVAHASLLALAMSGSVSSVHLDVLSQKCLGLHTHPLVLQDMLVFKFNIRVHVFKVSEGLTFHECLPRSWRCTMCLCVFYCPPVRKFGFGPTKRDTEPQRIYKSSLYHVKTYCAIPSWHYIQKEVVSPESESF